MEPLSPFTYARRNARKILPTVIILTFVVTLVVSILTTIAGLKDSMLIYAREFDHWTIAFPKNDTRLRPETVAAIADHPAAERVIPSRHAFVKVKSLVGPLPFIDAPVGVFRRADARTHPQPLPFREGNVRS